MSFWKIGFRMPQLADIAVPWCPCIRVPFHAFSTHSVCLTAFPLSCSECIALLAFGADSARTFFAVLGQQRLLLNSLAAQLSQEQVSPQTDASLKWSGVEGAIDEQMLASFDASESHVRRKRVSAETDAQICQHAFGYCLPETPYTRYENDVDDDR